jgi:methylmalonyl-CoA epimerase
MELGGLDHVGILARDFDGIARLAEVFGWDVGPVEALPEAGIEYVFVDAQGVRLEFIRSIDESSRAAQALKRGEGGVHHVAFEVDNAADALASLNAAGLKLRDLTPRAGVRGSKIGFAEAGPALIEVVEAMESKPTMSPVERLLAIEEIKTLKGRYFRYVDTKQWDRWGELFVEDCTFHDLAGDFRCQGRRDLVANVADALDGVVSVHHGHTPEIEIVDAGHASGIWAMADYLQYPPGKSFQSQDTSVRVFGYGHYIERYVRVEGLWRFQEVIISRLHLEHHGHMVAMHQRVAEP